MRVVTIAFLTIVGIAAVAAVRAEQGIAVDGACPAGFDLAAASSLPEGNWADSNADGSICALITGETLVLVDNGSQFLPIAGCPPLLTSGFNLIYKGAVPADRNGDGFVCDKDLPGFRTVEIDNNVPFNPKPY